MRKGQSSNQKIIDLVRASPAARVKVAVTDIDGVLRGKYIHKEKFLSAVDAGFGFCNVVFGWDMGDQCYDNATWTGWHTGFPDALAKIDLDTYRRVPWDDNVPFFLADFVDGKDQPSPVCPRQLLKKILARGAKQGFKVLAGVEYEWFNFRETSQSLAAKNFTQPETITPGMFGYSLIRASQNQPFFKALMEEMSQFGIPIEGLHTETGPGVYEAAISTRKRSRPPTARCCLRPRPKKSATASASCRASWRSGTRSTPVAAATCIKACRTAKRICFTTRNRRAA